MAPAEADPLCATPGRDGAGGTLSGVVNTYYPGQTATLAAGATSIAVGPPRGSAAPIAAGDLLAVMRMQGASINSANTTGYGDGVSGAPASGYLAAGFTAGTYEYVRATTAVVAGAVGVAGAGAAGGLVNVYSAAAATTAAGARTYQVVRVPQYVTATLGSALTAAAWDGTTGGVLAADTRGTLTLGGTVSVDGLGFRAGLGRKTAGSGGGGNDYRRPTSSAHHGRKGGGVAGSSTGDGYPNGDFGRGAPGNAGGGGTDGNPAANDQNSGGGGGATAAGVARAAAPSAATPIVAGTAAPRCRP